MTALCSGGTSSIVPGAAPTLIVSGGLITEGLLSISPWLLPAALLLDAFVYEATSSCGSDPPTQPTFDGDDLKNLIGGVLNPGLPTTLAKVHDTILRWLWFQYCKCDSVTTPTYVKPVQPSGVGVPIVTPSPGCFTGSFSGIPTQSTTPTSFNLSTPALMPPGTHSVKSYGSGQSIEVVAVPVGQYTSVRVTGTATFPAGATKPYGVVVEEFNAAGTFINNPGNVVNASAGNTVPVDWVIAIDPLTAFLAIFSGQTNEPNPATVSVTAAYSCTGNPVGGSVAPCPPDPTVVAVLQQIWQLLQLMQRQSVPFGYIASTVHAGLFDSGTLDISGLIGAKIDVTTLPAELGQSRANPVELFDLGFVTFGTPDGYPHSYRIEHDPQLVLPARAGAFTELAYDLHPGVVVTITELVREP